MYDMVNDYRWQSQIDNNIFAPTTSLHMLNHLNKFVQNHSIILSDFDYFLEPKHKSSILGVNAPLIQNKLANPTEVNKHDTYLLPRGASDILFPTDFDFL
jgi:hypothetical protein